jgi:hypothetical protein
MSHNGKRGSTPSNYNKKAISQWQKSISYNINPTLIPPQGGINKSEISNIK